MSFKDFSYLQLWWPYVQWNKTIIAILVEGYYGELLCEIISNLDQLLQRRCPSLIFFTI